MPRRTKRRRLVKVVPPDFYLDQPEVVARRLLGKLLIREIDGQTLIGRIVETEAYLRNDDPAAHSFAGMTTRNSVLFGPPGRAYVYFIYGMYYCLNVSCEPEGRGWWRSFSCPGAGRWVGRDGEAAWFAGDCFAPIVDLRSGSALSGAGHYAGVHQWSRPDQCRLGLANRG